MEFRAKCCGEYLAGRHKQGELSPFFYKIVCSRIPFGFQKVTPDPHNLAHVSIDRPDDRYPKLKIYISKLILCSYQYIPVACVAMHCMI
jgi:hypothetical protein